MLHAVLQIDEPILQLVNNKPLNAPRSKHTLVHNAI